MGPRFLEIANREVPHPDVPNPTRPVEGLEGLHRLPQRDLAPGIRPVNLVQVDLAHAESSEAPGTRLLHVVRAKMPPANLRRDKDAVPADVPDRSGHHVLGMPIAIPLGGGDELEPG